MELKRAGYITAMMLSVAVLTGGARSGGCATTDMYTLGGAAAGAGLGSIMSKGDRGKGALWGTIIGGFLGNQMGRQQENSQQLESRIQNIERQGRTETVWIQNPNGSQTPVVLERYGGQWKGPKGELYNGFPTEDQLRPYYALTK